MANRLIASLPRRERPRFIALCEPVELAFGDVLCVADARYESAYFPLRGSISLVAEIGGRPAIEMGLIGNEGMLGATLALGIDAAPLRAVVHSPGSALKIGVEQLRGALRDHPALARALSSYLYVLVAQLAQSAACTRFHAVDERLARWLLMTHDRVHADHFRLTHQHLADHLGVRRSAVTIAAGALHDREIIRYSRGAIRVLARDGLEAAACECYDAMRDDYAQHFAPLRPGAARR
ncbi:MAG TPA: Crp/Fnr family transcriptional regulator [Candidatus Saccharimonadia bacterium]|nr:Crp/Fnr family transcriptional regulator [Candidatus Saccharimonadia bacterium]